MVISPEGCGLGFPSSEVRFGERDPRTQDVGKDGGVLDGRRAASIGLVLKLALGCSGAWPPWG